VPVETTKKGRKALIVDDDELFCDSILDLLRGEGMIVEAVQTAARFREALPRENWDIVLLDQNLPDAEGHTLCDEILERNEHTKIIFVTAHPSFDAAVKALRAGAYDYLSKPFEMDELTHSIHNALRTMDLEQMALVERYKRGKEGEEAVLVGREGGLAEVDRLVDLAASADSPVFITGETGSGKNVVASAIHFRGVGKKKPFIAINCAALPENLIESELFGYQKGAFTGAVTSSKGIFEMAEGGTLFLDEIGELPMHLQTKLLGALENKKIKRLGGDFYRAVNVRIIAATGTNLESAIGKTFRSDLYYRLGVITIHLPPLRERPEDIPSLVGYMLSRMAGGRDVTVDENEMKKLQSYHWPGNVRELKNVLERALILQRSSSLRPTELLGLNLKVPPPVKADEGGKPIPTIEEMEKQHIRFALVQMEDNYTQTARALGISLSTLKRKVKRYGFGK
jgi:DNA-binding NtrC family response regulator